MNFKWPIYEERNVSFLAQPEGFNFELQHIRVCSNTGDGI